VFKKLINNFQPFVKKCQKTAGEDFLLTRAVEWNEMSLCAFDSLIDNSDETEDCSTISEPTVAVYELLES